MNNENKIKIVFLGAGAFAPPVLDALLRDPDIEVLSVVTQPDKPAGRKGVLTPSPLGKWCETAGVPFERVPSVNAPMRTENKTAVWTALLTSVFSPAP